MNLTKIGLMLVLLSVLTACKTVRTTKNSERIDEKLINSIDSLISEKIRAGYNFYQSDSGSIKNQQKTTVVEDIVNTTYTSPDSSKQIFISSQQVIRRMQVTESLHDEQKKELTTYNSEFEVDKLGEVNKLKLNEAQSERTQEVVVAKKPSALLILVLSAILGLGVLVVRRKKQILNVIKKLFK